MLPAEHTAWLGAEPMENAIVSVDGRAYTLHEKWGSYGYRLWPCSWSLASEMSSRVWTGRRICELGAGLGLPGMVASFHGADVTFLEKDRAIADWLRMTLWANDCHAKVITGDWHDFGETFDLVIGSDLIYESYGLDALAGFVAKSGKGLLANAGRTNYGPWATALYQSNLTSTASGLLGTHPDGRPFQVDLWDIARR